MDGVLVIDKSAGLTSHDVVAQARHILHERRIGHTGTLDPFGTGVLVVVVGRATRLAQFLSSAEKEYEAIIRLGFATDTGDVTGNRITDPGRGEDAISTGPRSEPEVEAALACLRGEIDQVPPMYSAKKQGGRKLYELARRGEEVERKPVRVCIHEFAPLKPDGPMMKDNLDGTFDCQLRVVCSSGTYVRTLAEDFGKRLEPGNQRCHPDCPSSFARRASTEQTHEYKRGRAFARPLPHVVQAHKVFVRPAFSPNTSGVLDRFHRAGMPVRLQPQAHSGDLSRWRLRPGQDL